MLFSRSRNEMRKKEHTNQNTRSVFLEIFLGSAHFVQSKYVFNFQEAHTSISFQLIMFSVTWYASHNLSKISGILIDLEWWMEYRDLWV